MRKLMVEEVLLQSTFPQLPAREKATCTEEDRLLTRCIERQWKKHLRVKRLAFDHESDGQL